MSNLTPVQTFMLWLFPYRYHERNPCRRYCKKCGQQQDYYQWNDGHPGRGWWEAMCRIHDEKCKCHRDCRHD